MPLTFPSHAAAILPLYSATGGRLHPSALVAGSMAPDLVYLLGLWATSSHHLIGVFTFCLPAGLLLFLWAEGLVLPFLARVLPSLGGVQPGRFLRTRGLPRSPGAWLEMLLALLLGIGTHLLWDGFTHAQMWPARALYPKTVVSPLGSPMPLPALLQHLSSALGALIVTVYGMVLYRHLQPAPGGRWRPFLLQSLLLLVLSGAAFALRFHWPPVHEAVRRTLWFSFWIAVDGGMLGVTLLALWTRPHPSGSGGGQVDGSGP